MVGNDGTACQRRERHLARDRDGRRVQQLLHARAGERGAHQDAPRLVHHQLAGAADAVAEV